MLTARDLNRATLARQRLLERQPGGVVDAVRAVVALQAQAPPSPYLALWNRVAAFDPSDLDAAFAARAVVKGNVPRITMHAVCADEHQAIREAMEPTIRSARLHDDRFRASGLAPADADAVVDALVAFARTPRPAAECEAWVADRLGGHPGTWWALRQYAPWLRHPSGGPWAFEGPAWYAAPPGRPRLHDPDAAAEGLQHLIWRYLEGFGPSSVADMALFCGVHRSRVKQAVAALGDGLEPLAGPRGEILYDVPGAPRPSGDTPAPARLLGMWDNVLLAHADRSRVFPGGGHRSHVARRNGDVLPTLLVDGYVVGVWRVSDGRVEALAFERLPQQAWTALAAEAASLRALVMSRDPSPYARYGHWWAKLPTGDARVLAG